MNTWGSATVHQRNSTLQQVPTALLARELLSTAREFVFGAFCPTLLIQKGPELEAMASNRTKSDKHPTMIKSRFLGVRSHDVPNLQINRLRHHY